MKLKENFQESFGYKWWKRGIFATEVEKTIAIMASHNTLGKAGEDAAASYLQGQGYVLRHRNWRKNHLELDIVAVKGDELVVVEVKTRRNTEYQDPQDAVDWKKVRHIVTAADAYIKQFGLDNPVRFDIVTVVGESGNFRIEHIEDAFYSPIF